jgi:hypothetical protein
MKKNKVTTNYDYLNDSAFETLGQTVNLSMPDNPNFPTPVPDLATINNLVVGYSAALAAAKTRDINAVAAKDDARDALSDALGQLANYVMTIANGDKTKLTSSGLELAKEGTFVPLVKPPYIILTDGVNAGELKVRVPRVPGSGGYVPQYTPDPLTEGSVWTQIPTTTSKYTFRNLASGQKLWVRVAVIGPFNQTVVSDAISRIVQ